MTTETIKLDKSEEVGTPVYFQLAHAIQEQIEKGVLVAGDLVTSERKIAAEYGISIATVRRAYEELVKKRFLKRVQGKGTFVTSTADRRMTIRYYPFVDSINEDVAVLQPRLISLRTVRGNAEVCRYLNIPQKQDLYEIKRILYRTGQPMVYCVSLLPKVMFPGLDECDESDFTDYAFYIFIEETFGVTTTNHIELTRAVPADPESAGALQISENQPLLEIEKVIFTHKNKPYEYRMSYCRTDTSRMQRYY